MGFKSFEVYNESRYLTVTGRVINGYRDVVDVQDVLDAMTAKLWLAGEQGNVAGEREQQEYSTENNKEQATLNDDSFLVQQASKGRRGEWFRSSTRRGHLRGMAVITRGRTWPC